MANFTLATTERVGQDREDRTEWHRIVAFGRLAEICGEYLAKGRQVFIEGRIQTKDWQDRDGNRRTTTEIVASNMQMLGRPQDGDFSARQPQQQSRAGFDNSRSAGPRGDGPRSGDRPREWGGNQGGNDDEWGPPPGDEEIPF